MYVFLSTLYTPQDEPRLLKAEKHGLQAAANNYQWGLLRGLSQLLDRPIETVNTVPMGSFPRHSRILLERSQHTQLPQANIHSPGFLNLPLIKQWQRRRNAYRQLKKLLKTSTEPVTVVAYSLYNPHLKAVARLKKRHSFRYILVVPDLPGCYGVESTNPILRFIQRRIGNRDLRLSQAADGYVVLTEQMKIPLQTGSKPCAVIEGIYNDRGEIPAPTEKTEPPVILYTGALDTAFGIHTLVEAFRLLPPGSAQLHIAGGGAYAETLKKAEDVCYLGYLPKDQVEARQRSATVLVNPRPNDRDYVKYSFPSKTIEYLASGTAVVMNRLPGVPGDYEDHVFFTERDDAQGLAQALQRVLSLDAATLAAHGAAAQAFIQTQKSPAPQAQKILTLANSL